MGFKAITVNTEASEPAHILAQDDATLYNHIIGADCVLDVGSRMEATIIDNNTVRIGDGAVVVQGHLGRTPFGEYDDMVIENGTIGQKRNDLVVARFQTVAGIDTFELAVLKGTPGDTATDPPITVGNLEKGDPIREYPLYRVKLDGLSITEVETMFSVGMTIESLRQALATHKAENAAKHITESGSNSNGRYVKYDDGTQICYIQRVITGTGGIFYDIDSSTFPATFADPSTIRVLVEVYNNHNGHSPADGCAMTYGFPVSTTMYHAGCKFPDSNGVPDHRQVYIFIVAIGRWK